MTATESGVRDAWRANSWAIVWPGSTASVQPQSVVLSDNKVVLQKQKFNTGTQESFDRFFRRVNDRLAFHIEAGVKHHLPSRGFSNRFQQLVKMRIVLF